MTQITSSSNSSRVKGVLSSPLVHAPIAAVLMCLLLARMGVSSYDGFVAVTILLYACAALGLNLVVGLLGQLSLGQGAAFAVGAYAAGITSVQLGWPMVFGIPLAAVCGGIVGVLISIPASRLGPIGVAMVSLGFTLVVNDIVTAETGLTGGGDGLFGIKDIAFPGGSLLSAASMDYVVVGAACILYGVHWYFRGSTLGTRCLALQDSEVASLALGLGPVVPKVAAFALGSAMGAIAGALFAYVNTVISPAAFGTQLSILLLLMVVLGGRGTRLGPVVGALVVGILPYLLSGHPGANSYIYGALLIGVAIFLPRGIFTRTGLSGKGHVVRRVIDAGEAALVEVRVEADIDSIPVLDHASLVAAPPERDIDSIPVLDHLTLVAVSRSFGGIQALQEVSMTAPSGRIVGLIGPNGSGKTTLLNLVSGMYSADSGSITVGCDSVVGKSPQKIARLGVSRTFQLPKVFGHLTIGEHLDIALRARWRDNTPEGDNAVAMSAVRTLLDRPDTRELDRSAGSLSHGSQRFLELSIAILRAPRLLILDEPAAGLSLEEIDQLMEVVRKIATEGAAVVIVEHHLDVIQAVCDYVYVLSLGELIWHGPSADLYDSELVRVAYLGGASGAVL